MTVHDITQGRQHHSREHGAVVSHDDLVKDGADHAPVNVNLLRRLAKHLREKERELHLTHRARELHLTQSERERWRQTET